MFSKDAQLKKDRRLNKKRLSKKEMNEFRRFISDTSNNVCQLCKIRQIQDAHHPIFGCRGADKDDRCQVGVCRECHEKCHNDKHGKLNSLAIKIGHKNYKNFLTL